MKNLFFFLLFLGLLIGCNSANVGVHAKGDNDAANRAKFQGFYDQVINAHNPNLVDSFCHADFVDHNPSPGHSGKGLDDLKGQFRDFFTAFPDVHFKTNFMVACGDTLVSHISMTGTNSGPMAPGMPATNKSFSADGIDIVVIKDGKATERWGFGDSEKMMKDLGMMGGPPADTTHAADMKK